MKQKEKPWHKSKAMFDDLAKELGATITEYSYVSDNGVGWTKPRMRRGIGCECTGVTFSETPGLVAAAITAGFKQAHNSHSRYDANPDPAALCYERPMPFETKWGDILQVWPNGRARINYDSGPR